MSAVRNPLRQAIRQVVRGAIGTPTGFNPASMFTNNEPGWVYDLSDFSTLFQDSAGTIPVTAVEQPVRLVLDKSGNGNHARQASTTKRPVLSSRVNLLTWSEDFTNAAWNKNSLTITMVAAPDGTTTAGLLAGTGVGQTFLRIDTTYAKVVTTVLRIKQGTSNRATIGDINIGALATFALDTATVVPGSVHASVTSATATPIEGGYVECRVTHTPWVISSIAHTLSPGTKISTTTTGTIYIWHPQLNFGTTALPYQRITTATSYDTEGFPLYLKGDGIDDFMSTAAINFTGTDTISYWGGVQKLSDTNAGVVFELGTDSATVNGTFGLLAPHTGTSSTFAFNSRGTAYAQAVATGYASPYSGTISVANDISTPSLSIAVNTDAAFTNGATQGTGNYSSNPVYFMSRAGTSTFFGGQTYSSIMLGRAATPTEAANSKAWVDARRTVTA